MVDNLKGAKVIHNHPDEYGMFGDSFSIEDFTLYFKEQIKELQVVSGLGRYTLKTKEYVNDLEAGLIFRNAKAEVIIDAIKNKKVTEYEQFEIMKYISNKYPQFIFKGKDD